MRVWRKIALGLAIENPLLLCSAGERLLLRAALLDGADARQAWDGWRGSVGSIEAVDPAAFRLLPMVYRNLEAAGVDDPDLPVLKGVYRYTWVANQRLVGRVSPALQSLLTAGIPTMVLRGAAASVTHYRSLGARPMDEVDILVRRPDAVRALDILRGRGWSAPAAIDSDRVMRNRHATRLRDPTGTEVGLHWRVLPESARDDDFWSNAVPVFLGDAQTLAPGPTEQLLHACAHGVRLASAGALQWIADGAVILHDAGSEVDWSRLVNGATERNVTVRTARSLALLRELAGLPIPTDVLAQLEAAPSGLRGRLLFGLAERTMPGSRWILRLHRSCRTIAPAFAHRAIGLVRRSPR